MEHFLGLPPVASEHGFAVDRLIIIIHGLMFLLFAGWTSFYLYTIFRFRRSAHPKAHHSGIKSKIVIYLSLAVAVIEIALDVAYSVPVWNKQVKDFPPADESTVIRVVAEQYAWNVHYAGADGVFGKTSLDFISPDNPLGLDPNDAKGNDDITTINQIHVPVNKPVIIRLSSKDVIHSFNLPLMRIKQDVIPGMVIPIWFQPIKTSAELQKELTRTLSLREIASKTITVGIPQEQIIELNGNSLTDYVLTEDAVDSTGTAIAYAGDFLTKGNINLLISAHVTKVKARLALRMNTYIVAGNITDKTGTVAVASGESVTEDAVTRAMKASASFLTIRPSVKSDAFIVTESYKDATGNVLIEKNSALDETIINALLSAGIDTISVTPETPAEIGCAQLCGLGHYRMRGFVTIETPEEYAAWLAEQSPVVSPSNEPPLDSSSAVSQTIRSTTLQEN